MADNITTFVCGLFLNLEALTSWNSQGLSRPVGLDRDSFSFTFTHI
jgi:hypothetical protein